MLPTNRRIKKEAFTKIVKGGVFFHVDNFYLVLLDKKDNSPSCFSFIVSNKVKKTSVGRHLLKRRISRVVEKKLPNLKNGLSGLIYAKKGASILLYSEIESEILKLLKKANLLN